MLISRLFNICISALKPGLLPSLHSSLQNRMLVVAEGVHSMPCSRYGVCLGSVIDLCQYLSLLLVVLLLLGVLGIFRVLCSSQLSSLQSRLESERRIYDDQHLLRQARATQLKRTQANASLPTKQV